MLASRRVLCLVSAAFAATVVVTHEPTVAQVILGLPDEAAPAKAAASDGVKTGMAAIRKLVVDAHTLITHRRLAPEGARRFAGEVKRHVGDMKSAPDAARLDGILDDISQGADAIAAPGSGDGKLDGLDKIESALVRYPQLFEDPNWKPLR